MQLLRDSTVPIKTPAALDVTPAPRFNAVLQYPLPARLNAAAVFARCGTMAGGMANVRINSMFETALTHHKAERLAYAEPLYQQILAQDQNHAETLHAYGMLARQTGRLEQAIELFARAVAVKRSLPDWWNSYGITLGMAGQYEKAIEAFRKVIQLNHSNADAHNNLGTALAKLGRFQEAADACMAAIRLAPHAAGPHDNLGAILHQNGQLDDAIACFQNALQRKPDFAEAHHHMATCLMERLRFDEAENASRQAIRLKPNYAEAHNILGMILARKGQGPAAYESFCQAIRLSPRFADAYCNLASLLQENGQFSEANQWFRKAIEADPNHAASYVNLAEVLREQGLINDALECSRRGVELDPTDYSAHCNRLFMLHFSPDLSPEQIFQEHLAFDRQHAQKQRVAITAHTNDRSPHRRLRIGYVSPDLRRHSVAYFVEPILQHHDHQRFEVICYADVAIEDAFTHRMKAYADRWFSTVGKTFVEVANQVKSDQIDILVDLAGHTGNNRLMALSRKPAPIQVSMIGYPDTTGISTVDYRITDEYADPTGTTEQFHTETLVRLPDCFLCYRPPDDAPAVAALPAESAGYVTFGSFNFLKKITDPLLAMWAQILQAMPASRLIVKTQGLDDPGTRQLTLDRMARQGIPLERVELRGRDPSFANHMGLYNRIDIALDTYPYHGTTTTCEALWMGVPVITLAGSTHVSRVGASLLSNVGLQDLIARSALQYVDHAVSLAADLPRLRNLRMTLRDRMINSPLMNTRAYVSSLEQAYQRMWQTWCASR